MLKFLKILFIIIVFVFGIYFYTKFTNIKLLEGLTSMNQDFRCPNILIQKDAKFYLYNSNIAEVPGVNPIEFNNLEEYVEFLEWQRGAGIRCPVLYVQNTYDAQGERVYKIRPSVTELQGGLPPTLPVQLPTKFLDISTTTNGSSTNPSYDQSSYYVQTSTPAGAANAAKENLLYSDNAMDPNWGGADYTQALVDTGYYSGNEVSIDIP